MIPKYHTLLGAVFSILIYFLFSLTPFQATLIFLASFLIDFDHYLWYALRKKDLNPINSTKWFFKKRKIWIKLPPNQRRKIKLPILIFHGIEFWILLIILSFLNPLFIYILIGVLFHAVFDFIELFYLKEPLYFKASQVLVYLKNKKNKDLIKFIEKL